MVLRSPALRRVVEQAERAAPTGCHVLILGERGVGKEVLAQHLATHSRRKGRLVAVNCAAIQPALLESTLFGHARGAFTGANNPSKGLVREAGGGTLFLDEVGELPGEVQARLLRLLQEGVIQPLGEPEQKVDVRIVAATNRDLDQDVASGRFRADLRDRLHLLVLRVPPLRERRMEIVPLAEHFLATAPELDGTPRPVLTSGARGVLRGQPWPGNVRELRNAVVRAAILNPGAELTAKQMREAIDDGPKQGEASSEAPRALDSLQIGRAYAMAELVEALRLRRGTVKRRVGAWVARGVLLMEGVGRRRRYRLPDDGEAACAALPAGGAQVRVLAWLRGQGPASTGELASALNVPLTTLKRAIRALRSAGQVRLDGIGRASRVSLVVEGASSPPQTPPPAPPAGPPAVVPSPLTPHARHAAEQEQAALRLAERGATTARAVAASLGQCLRTAERVLARLIRLGLLRADGFARARRYVLLALGQPSPQVGPAAEVRSPPPASPPAAPGPPSRPVLSLGGRALNLEALRVALRLAADPLGVSPILLSERGAVPEREAAHLLGSLGAAGLLAPLPGAHPAWRLHPGERGAVGDTS